MAASPSPKVIQLPALGSSPITSLSFNATQTQAAVALGSSRILILDCNRSSSSESRNRRETDAVQLEDPSTWRVAHVLRRHHGHVSCLAWHPITNAILSCGHDREAYVWVCQRSSANPRDTQEATSLREQEEERWVPQLVVLDTTVSRGLTCAAWSLSGEKLYLGSAAAVIAVGCYDVEQRWWVCRVLAGGHKSTITALAPHPVESALLASGGLDGALVLSSSLMKRVDGKGAGAASFGTVYLRQRGFSSDGGGSSGRNRAWVHAVAWSPSGERLAVATHDSRLHVLFVGREATVGLVKGSATPLSTRACKATHICTVYLASLPLLRVTFQTKSEHEIVGVGCEPYPVLFRKADNTAAQSVGGGEKADSDCKDGHSDEGGDSAELWTLAAVGVKPIKPAAVCVCPNASADRPRLTDILAASSYRHTGTILCVASALDGEAFITAGEDGRILHWSVKDLVRV